MLTNAAVGVHLASHKPAFDPVDSWKRLGLIALATDLTSERDFARLIPHDQVALYTARIAFENPTTPEQLAQMGPRLGDCAELLKALEPLAAVCYSCTSASVVLGDEQVRNAIQAVLPDVPVITPSYAARLAFQALNARRIALLTPYLINTTRPFVHYFEQHGIEVVNAECFGIDDDRLMARVRRSDIVQAAIAADRPEADVIFLSCTGLPAIATIDEIEQHTGKPVVSSNQASLWAMLHHAGVDYQLAGHGRLFSHSLPMTDGAETST